ncbi:unnamed protein product [Paramecium sonneborni]|uniref:Uncharacterized protein n=1 Tax=Paramecium sonneborni TaxID=65129 RepID=A0A8S1RNC6_9CILI|nr:unnamed protein product [Paramecium sonneborni]
MTKKGMKKNSYLDFVHKVLNYSNLSKHAMKTLFENRKQFLQEIASR